MGNSSCRVLLVEQSEVDYLVVRELLSLIATPRFELERVSNYAAARVALGQTYYPVCLLDDRMDDGAGAIKSGGEGSCEELMREFGRGETSFILLTDSEDYELDVTATRLGAADYLLKEHLNAPLLERSIRYAIERKRTEAALGRAQSFAQATVDALPDHIAVLDEAGRIATVSAVWRDVGASEGFVGAGSCVGANYLEACDASDTPEGWACSAGIRAVLKGEMEAFCLEYSCYNAPEPQWFQTCARRFPGLGPLHIVIAHADISKRKIAEEKLRQSEANLAHAQQIARLGSWELSLTQIQDIYANPLHWSDEVFRIFGYEPGQIEVSTENFFAAVHPDDRERIAQALTEAVRDNTTYSVDHRILLPDGSERIVHEQSALVWDEKSGARLKMVGTVQDITEQKQIERALHEREEFQRTLLENFPNGSVNVFDRDLRYILAAGRGLEQTGLKPDHLTGKMLDEIYTPEQVALVKPHYERVLSHETVEFELPLGERFYNISAAPLHNREGEVGNIIAVAQDFTERKRAETQLHFQKTLLEAQSEASPDGILVVSGAGSILSYNGRFVEMWGIPPHIAAGGKDEPVLEAVVQQVLNPQEFLKRVQHLYEHWEERSNEEIFLRDGRTFNRYSAPITSADGTYYGRVWYFHDITHYKAASEAMTRLAAIVESSSDAIISKTLDGTITSWNAGAEMLYGYTSEEAIGRSIWMLAAPNRPDDEALLLDKTGRGERVKDYETVRVCKDGRQLDVSLTLSPLRDEAGAVIGVSAIARDISDRKRVETALRESQERFKHIVSNAPGMVYQFVVHCDGSISWPFVSEGCRDLYEVEPEFVQCNPNLLVDMTHPEDRAEFDRTVAESARTLLPWNWKGRIRLASGKIRWTQGTSRPQRLPDGSTLWDGIVMDITARIEAEAERDRFFTMSPDMLGIVGLDGYFKRLNPAFAETLGFSSAELMAEPFLNWIHPEDRDPTLAAVAELVELAQENNIAIFENRYRSKDGSYRWLEWKSAIVVEEGVIYTAARDVTERKASDAALLRLRNELEERVEERTAELEDTNATLQAEIVERQRAEREVRVQARQHEAVADLGRRALLDSDLDTLFNGTIALISATLDVEMCAFWELVPGSDTLRWCAGAGANSNGQFHPVPPKTIGDNSHIGYAALLNEPVISHDLQQETRFETTSFLAGQGVSSTIAIPVHDDAFYGVLSACSTDKQKFGQNEIFFLQTVANVLSSAIARRQTQTEIHALNLDLQGANEELRANETRLIQGNQISTDLMRLRVRSHDELQEALRQITEASSTMLDVERSSVWLFNPEGTHLRCNDLYERNAHRHTGDFEITQDAATFELIKKQRIIMVDDVRNHPTLGSFWKEYFEPRGIISVLEIALVVGGRHIGVLCLSHVGEPRQWQAEDRTFASAIASVCSLVLESYERSRVETALQGAKEEAERATAEANAANAAKSEFLSRMSHELRTPLNAILGFGQILEMRSNEPKQLGNIQQILKAGRHLLSLINEVLDVARIEAGHLSLSLEPICAGVVVSETLELVQPLAAARGIHLVNQVVGETGTWHLLADQQRLKQVLLNLLSNAVKYNRENGEVFVSARVVETEIEAGSGAETKWLRFEVRDTGAGLSDEDICKLFVPFERLQAAHTQIEGTGIGLTLCKRLVEAMNGHIGVYSNQNQQSGEQGSIFWVELPLVSAQMDRGALLENGQATELAVLPLETLGTILYIEDNLSNITLIQQVLREQPHQVRLLTAMQGRVGLELAALHLPDLILLDVHLPDIMGDVVLSRLKADPATRDIPVVVLSADATPSQVERLMGGGAQAYLTKPLDLKHFFRVLHEVVGQSK